VTQARLVGELTNDAVLYALAGSVAFLLFVLILDPRLVRSPIGRSLITLDAGLVLLYVPLVLHRFFGLQISQITFSWYYLGTILIVGTATLWRTVIMIRTQLRAKRGKP
jgi:hypothetical protein